MHRECAAAIRCCARRILPGGPCRAPVATVESNSDISSRKSQFPARIEVERIRFRSSFSIVCIRPSESFLQNAEPVCFQDDQARRYRAVKSFLFARRGGKSSGTPSRCSKLWKVLAGCNFSAERNGAPRVFSAAFDTQHERLANYAPGNGPARRRQNSSGDLIGCFLRQRGRRYFSSYRSARRCDCRPCCAPDSKSPSRRNAER